MTAYSELRKESRIDLAAAVPLAAPLTIYVEPTSRCNLSCDFCPQSLDDYEDRAGLRQDMPLSLWRKVMDEVRELSVKSLKLYFFGEPLLHPNIIEMLAVASGACERVELTTNGMALTPAISQAILTHVDYLRVSIYPTIPHPELVVRNVSYLWEQRKSSRLTICAKVFTAAEAEAARRLYSEIVDEIHVDGLHTIGSEFVQISQQAKDSRRACPYPFYNLVVKASGDVVPCCVAWEDSLIVGNAYKQTLREVWAGEALAKVHRLHLEGRRGELAACRSCDTIFNSPDSVDGLSAEEYSSRRE